MGGRRVFRFEPFADVRLFVRAVPYAAPAVSLRRILSVLFLFAATLRLAGQTVTVTPSATTYAAAGGTITFTVTFQFTQSLSTLGMQITAPSGWAFGELGGTNRPQVAPTRGTTGTFDFAYFNVPTSPASFTFTATYGGGLTGNQTFSGILAILRTQEGEPIRPTASNIVLTAATTGGDGGAATAPAIVSAPVGLTVAEGGQFSLSVIATGTAPLTYQWLKDGAAVAGATGSTYAVAAASAAAAGSYTVRVANAQGAVTSTSATVSVTARAGAPVILSQPQGANAVEGTGLTLNVAVRSDLAVSYQWRRNGVAIAGATAASLRLAGTVAESGDYTVAVTNSAGSVVSAPAVVAFTSASQLAIVQQPLATAAAPGEAVVLRVVATGPGTISYQWRKDGVPLNGATAAELRLTNVTTADAGEYVVEVVSAGGRLTSSPARLTVAVRNAAPNILRQPTALIAVVGASATLNVTAVASPAPTYQWRRNGVVLPGATSATLVLSNVQAADAGGYEVVVTNPFGAVTSSLALVTVQTASAAPIILRQPASIGLQVGREVALTVTATGAPAPVYRWSKDGALIAGATAATLTLSNVQPANAGSYTVEVSNGLGSVGSPPAQVRVFARSFAGSYFGALPDGGSFALQVREDNTGVYLAFDPATRTALATTNVTVGDDGGFNVTVTAQTSAPSRAGAALPGVEAVVPRAAADSITLAGNVNAAGVLTVTASGATRFSGSGARVAGASTVGLAGYYEASAAGGTAQLLGVVGPAGQALVVTRANGAIDGGTGTVTAEGRLTVTTAATQSMLLNVNGASGAISGQATAFGAGAVSFAGFRDSAPALAEQRLSNISARTTAGVGDAVAIVGFVIEGLEAKPVLIRAVGPALRGFGLTDPLAAPRLELLRGQATLAVNSGWSAGGTSAEIAAAATRAGAFSLVSGSADAALLTTLQPGAYSAVVSAADGRPGVGLVEVYDLSGASGEQRLVNISTRATAGVGDATLSAGLVVSGTAPKRVLVRAAGPALAAFGVRGVLGRPLLRIFSGETVVAQNAGWSTAPDPGVIAAAAGQVGAFAFEAASADAAILINLAPGAFTAQVTSTDGGVGIALIEVYDVR